MTEAMAEHTVLRDGDLPLKFTGELLSTASSERPDKDRWFEVKIFRTDDGRYVVAGAGITVFADEDDRYWATVCVSPHEVIDVLRRRGDDGSYLPKTSQYALWRAARVDPGLEDAYAATL